MGLVQGDESVRTGVVQRVDPGIARRASVTAPMGHEKDVAVIAEKLSQLGLPAGFLLAAVVVENGAERPAPGRPVDEPAKLELAAGKGHLFRLGGEGGRREEREEETGGPDRRLAFFETAFKPAFRLLRGASAALPTGTSRA